ncbi:Double-strand-break repair protein rad21-like protein 1 [Erysiphe neolycopersici]|uniref:Double-strand-break repair protein rad21-like protein 1 n=1 Tax=Erysiphe neolycopersici TaxID=212602 RepID=A0A420H9X8_9PEZI|nr:Double-strand-break repair protein rad21-like protein 1 [Erysiphe neolycopersici]
MFYSESLLSKTGPLARVWLSANIERRLSKNHVLQTNVKDSVDAIVMPNQAPLALRLTGQLLLGVARIYRRKAIYLLDDCNEALIKIKMAFRTSGNNDMTEGLHAPSRDALMLPDVLTEGDDLEIPTLPDASFLISQTDDDSNNRKKRAGSRDINLQEDFSSQFIQSSIENTEEILEPMDELDLGLDLGFDLEDGSKNDLSIEMGRNISVVRDVEDDLVSKLDIQVPAKSIPLDVLERDASLNIEFGNDSAQIVDDGIRVGDNDMDVEMYMGDQQDLTLPSVPLLQPERISESPLSDIDESIVRAEATLEYKIPGSNPVDQEEQEKMDDQVQNTVIRKPAQRAKRHRQLHPDPTIELSSAQIKSQQSNRDKILQPRNFVPRDQALLTLMQMQRRGEFISSAIREAQSDGWAPELRGILSLNAVRNLKRKRVFVSESVGKEVGDEKRHSSRPRLQLPSEDEDHIFASESANADNFNREELNSDPALQDQTIIEMGSEIPRFDDDQEESTALEQAQSPAEVHTSISSSADPKYISLGAKHAVNLLRDHFGSENNSKNPVLFEELLPTSSVSRVDATKFFFEILVLGTKDALKVEQPPAVLGGPITINSKAGLWLESSERGAAGDSDDGFKI